MSIEKRALAKYVNTATDLAEAVKRDIQHGGKITNDTVLKLNKFRVAANAVSDMIEQVNKIAITYDN